MNCSVFSNMLLLSVISIFSILVAKGERSQINQLGCGNTLRRTMSLMRYSSNAIPGKWPWHAALYHQNDRESVYVCGGTVISRSHVLTAAHCVINPDTQYQQNTGNIFVVLGAYNLNNAHIEKRQTRYNVTSIHKMDEYDCEKHRYDIAVLSLGPEAIEFNEFVQPACVYQEEVFEGNIGTVVGWGYTEYDTTSSVLKEAQLPVVHDMTCLDSDRAAFGPTLNHGMFCAGHLNGTGVCNGDSGGGFFLEVNGTWHVAGIVSFTASRQGNAGLCQLAGYAVFTKISHYLAWLNNVTAADTSYCEPKSANGTMISASAFPADCGVYSPNKMRKGEPAKLSEFPWMAILLDEEDRFVYHGTLIAKQYILTSAYCVTANHPTRVRLGEHDRKEVVDCDSEQHCAPPTQDYDIECTIPHQDYNPKMEDNDIALIRTKQEVLFQEHIQPVCLPLTAQLRQTVLPRYITTGWGATEPGGALSAVLNKANVKAIDKVKCYFLAMYIRSLSDYLCIGSQRTPNACGGDMGAPLGHTVQFNGARRFVQFGIASWIGCNRFSSIYTNVSAHMDWVTANVKP